MCENMDISEIKDVNEDVSFSNDEECGSSSNSNGSSGKKGSGSKNGSSSSCDSSSSDSGSDSEADKPSAPKKGGKANADGVPEETDGDRPASPVPSAFDLSRKIDAMVADLEKHCRETYKGRLRSEFKAVMPPVYKRHLGGLDRIFCIPHSMEPQAFEAQKFQSALLPDDLKDRQSRDAFISRLKTTIRWRQCEDKETGALYKESNTRIVRWSDGSETLHIGAEAYELISHPTPLGHDHLYVRQNSHHYLIGPIREKMRLHSDIESKFGQTHVQPVSSCVSTNPMLDRERMIREDQAQERREKFEKMREQKNQCKPTVKPTRYCTAGDSNSAALAANQVSRPDDHVFRKPLLPPIKRAAGARAKRNTNVNVEQNEEDIDNDVEGKEKVSPGIKRKSNVKQVQPKPKRKQPPKAVLSDSE